MALSVVVEKKSEQQTGFGKKNKQGKSLISTNRPTFSCGMDFNNKI
jgi:hypothetical protein